MYYHTVLEVTSPKRISLGIVVGFNDHSSQIRFTWVRRCSWKPILKELTQEDPPRFWVAPSGSSVGRKSMKDVNHLWLLWPFLCLLDLPPDCLWLLLLIPALTSEPAFCRALTWTKTLQEAFWVLELNWYGWGDQLCGLSNEYKTGDSYLRTTPTAEVPSLRDQELLGSQSLGVIQLLLLL